MEDLSDHESEHPKRKKHTTVTPCDSCRKVATSRSCHSGPSSRETLVKRTCLFEGFVGVSQIRYRLRRMAQISPPTLGVKPPGLPVSDSVTRFVAAQPPHRGRRPSRTACPCNGPITARKASGGLVRKAGSDTVAGQRTASLSSILMMIFSKKGLPMEIIMKDHPSLLVGSVQEAIVFELSWEWCGPIAGRHCTTL